MYSPNKNAYFSSMLKYTNSFGNYIYIFDLYMKNKIIDVQRRTEKVIFNLPKIHYKTDYNVEKLLYREQRDSMWRRNYNTCSIFENIWIYELNLSIKLIRVWSRFFTWAYNIFFKHQCSTRGKCAFKLPDLPIQLNGRTIFFFFCKIIQKITGRGKQSLTRTPNHSTK